MKSPILNTPAFVTASPAAAAAATTVINNPLKNTVLGSRDSSLFVHVFFLPKLR